MKKLLEERQVRQVWQAVSTGKRRRGRPIITWDKEVENLLRSRRLPWNQGENLSSGRSTWRVIVRTR